MDQASEVNKQMIVRRITLEWSDKIEGIRVTIAAMDRGLNG